MKKLFIYMAMILATVTMTTSCEKNDDRISADEFCKLLVNGDWQGYCQEQHREWGSFTDRNDRTWNVLRFRRNSENATYGSGTQLGYSSEQMTDRNPEVSSFIWRIDGTTLTISYDAWSPVYFNFTEMTINSDKFAGFMYEKDDVRYEFNYSKRAFNNWDTFIK